MNNDGYPDVVVGFYYSNHVTWFRNTDGLGDFWIGVDIAADMGDGVKLADIDGDGGLDVVAVSDSDGTFVCSGSRPTRWPFTT